MRRKSGPPGPFQFNSLKRANEALGTDLSWREDPQCSMLNSQWQPVAWQLGKLGRYSAQAFSSSFTDDSDPLSLNNLLDDIGFCGIST